MPATAHATGPGTLTFGEVGGPEAQDFSCQVTKVAVTTKSDSEDDQPTLCGDVIAGEQTDSATLEATFAQDFSREGVVAWSWANKGKQVPVRFIPNLATDMEVVGTITVRPLNIGGDAKKKNTSDVEWPFVGFPTLDWPAATGA